MTATVQRHGRYTMFETPRENRILSLGSDLWFAWVEGEQGEILVRSDADHERQRTLQEGEYYLVDFKNDESFTDVPHLFLERDGEFQEIILPNGLPTDDDAQKRVSELTRQSPGANSSVSLRPAPGRWIRRSGQPVLIASSRFRTMTSSRCAVRRSASTR